MGKANTGDGHILVELVASGEWGGSSNDPCAVRLLSYEALDADSEGRVFTNKTKLCRTSDWQGLRRIEERIAGFAGSILYVYITLSKPKEGISR